MIDKYSGYLFALAQQHDKETEVCEISPVLREGDKTVPLKIRPLQKDAFQLGLCLINALAIMWTKCLAWTLF